MSFQINIFTRSNNTLCFYNQYRPEVTKITYKYYFSITHWKISSKEKDDLTPIPLQQTINPLYLKINTADEGNTVQRQEHLKVKLTLIPVKLLLDSGSR